MATNMTETLAERPPAEDLLSVKHGLGIAGKENGSAVPAHEAEAGQKLALASLVDKIAFGIARGLVVAMKELEDHIASETRKVGETFGRRMDTFQVSLQELAELAAQQRSFNASIQERCESLGAGQEAGLASVRSEAEALAVSVKEQIVSATVPLKQADADQQQQLETLRTTTAEISAAISERVDALCRELNVHQEDIATIQSTLGAFSASVEGMALRLDRQAEALRTMSAAYAQRETELESLVAGLARMRAYPAPGPLDRL